MRWLIFLVGCTSLHSSFECRTSSQCSGGVCEATGFCSFSSTDCGSGRRYGHFSGALADECTDAVSDDGGGASDLSMMMTSGDLGDGGAVASGCAIALGGGNTHVCAIVSDGTVECWGAGTSGQLGGTTNQQLPTTVLDSQKQPLKGSALALGDLHTCAVSTTETLNCWGGNDHGQLGTGASPSPQPTPALLSLNPVKRAAAGSFHSCAVVGTLLWCWGRNDDGQLAASGGDSFEPEAALAMNGTQITDVTELALGRAHSCALISGHVQCWGLGGAGQVSGLGKVIHIAAGGDRTCAILDDQSVWCWSVGQIPAQVMGVSASAIAVAGDHACAAQTVGGGVVCWDASLAPGNNLLDLDGNPLTGVVELAAGAGYTCARTDRGVIYCAGVAATLGDGTSVDRTEAGPVRMTCP